MKKVLLHVALFIPLIASAQSLSVQEYYSKAREAHKAKDYPAFYSMIKEANKLHPYHQGILYNAGVAAALTDKPEEAISFLNKAVQINAGYDLAIEDLKSLREREDFKKLQTFQTNLQKKIIQSDTAFIIKDKTLHLESITPGESKNIFYVGSIHKRKIIRVDEKGNTSDFTASAQDGLCSVFGIKVDAAKKILWACSSPMVEMENFDTTATSGVFKYDLKTGKLISRYTPEEKKEYIFGDLTLDPSGKVFVSDSKNNIIFTVNEANGKLEPYFTSEEFWNLQGLSFTPDNRYLFIADYIKGIFRLDTKTKTLKPVEMNFQLSSKSIDGLTFYNNSLIAIQNAISPMRVTQYKLNDTLDKFVGFTIIDNGHPAFNEPTIGCVRNDIFYYVANSLWSGYTEQHQLKTADQLQDVVILRADLKKLK